MVRRRAAQVLIYCSFLICVDHSEALALHLSPSSEASGVTDNTFDNSSLIRAATKLVGDSEWYQKQVIDQHAESAASYEQKFLNYTWEVNKAFRQSDCLGLHKRSSISPRFRVLDLGSGSGWFVWVMQKMGHDAKGLEPLSTWTSVEKGNMTRLLGVEPIDVSVQPFAPLPSPPEDEKYDVITSWMTMWDHLPVQGRNSEKDQSGKYGPMFSSEMWAFVLKDIACNQLKPGGIFMFEENTYVPASQKFSVRGKPQAEKAGVVFREVDDRCQSGGLQMHILTHMEGLC